MKRLATALAFFSAFLLSVYPNGELLAQAANGVPGESTVLKDGPTASSSAQGTPKSNTLFDGTPVKLRLQRNLSSSDAHVGEQVDFEVLEEVKVGEIVVIPKGAVALATVITAEHKKTMGRGGKLDVNIDNVRLADQEKANLRATQGGKGGGHVGAMTGAIVATSIVFFPAAPLFLFVHGKDITIPKGTEVTAYVIGDMPINPANFALNPTSIASISSPNAIPANSEVAIDASQLNCEIEIDGSFVGNTPSQLSLTQGKHEITVKKKGYSHWTKTMMISGPSVHLQAELDAIAPPAPAL